MLAFTNAKEKQSPTIIGAGCKLTGDIKTDHTVQIHGQVNGNITADTVVIGRGGRVMGRGLSIRGGGLCVRQGVCRGMRPR